MGNVKRRPDGQWRARYRGPDQRERSKHFARKSDAERWLAAVEVAKTRGEWIDPSLSRETVGAWCRTWLAAQGQLKPSTRASTGASSASTSSPCRAVRHWPGFFIGVAGAGLNYSLVISIMVFLSVGRVMVRLSRRCAGFHAPVGVLS